MNVFSELETKNAIGRDLNGDLAFVSQVLAYPTRHKVYLENGKNFSAMCAIDSLVCTFTFQQDTRIDASCSFCSKPVSVTVTDGQLFDSQPSTLTRTAVQSE